MLSPEAGETADFANLSDNLQAKVKLADDTNIDMKLAGHTSLRWFQLCQGTHHEQAMSCVQPSTALILRHLLGTDTGRPGLSQGNMSGNVRQ